MNSTTRLTPSPASAGSTARINTQPPSGVGIQAARPMRAFGVARVRPQGSRAAHARLVQQCRQREKLEKATDEAPLPSNVRDVDAFCFLLTTSEVERIELATGCTQQELSAFQNFLSGKTYSPADAKEFAIKWAAVSDNQRGVLLDLPGGKEVNVATGNYLRAMERISLTCTTLGQGEVPTAAGDIGQQKGGAILNPASRKGIGARGASLAIQKGKGPGFTARQKALYAHHVNLVGNARVGDAYVVPTNEQEAVVSVAGPNLKSHTGLGFKLHRIALGKSTGPSKRQARKLRTAYRSYFAGVDAYNRKAAQMGKPALTQLHMVPISANIFGYPADEAVLVMLQETLRYLARSPDAKAHMMTVTPEGNPGGEAVQRSLQTRLQELNENAEVVQLRGEPRRQAPKA